MGEPTALCGEASQNDITGLQGHEHLRCTKIASTEQPKSLVVEGTSGSPLWTTLISQPASAASILRVAGVENGEPKIVQSWLLAVGCWLLAIGNPQYGINHLVAQVSVGVLEDTVLPPTFGALLVSGGHTEILKVTSLTNDVQLLGATIDDAAGEAYDKTARLLGLGYPGGPAIDKAAKDGDKKAFRFPRGLSLPKFVGSAEEPGKHRNNFSFSGLKTAVARCVEHFEAAGEPIPVADISASFQEAVVDVITSKAVRAMQENGLKTLLLGGGVAANTRLRELLAARCASAGITLVVPPFSLCTDNGGMVAALGAQLVAAGAEPSGLDFATDSSQPVTNIVLKPRG